MLIVTPTEGTDPVLAVTYQRGFSEMHEVYSVALFESLHWLMRMGVGR
jgi:hypothetical protein